jgi:hypothetical protein
MSLGIKIAMGVAAVVAVLTVVGPGLAIRYLMNKERRS